MGKGKGTGPGRPQLGRVNFQTTIAPETKKALVMYGKAFNMNQGRVVDKAVADLLAPDAKAPE